MPVCVCACLFETGWVFVRARLKHTSLHNVFFLIAYLDVWSKEAISSFGVNFFCILWTEWMLWMWSLVCRRNCVYYSSCKCAVCERINERMKARPREGGQRHNTSSFTSASFPNKERPLDSNTKALAHFTPTSTLSFRGGEREGRPFLPPLPHFCLCEV